jgi:hypothetical protein
MLVFLWTLFAMGVAFGAKSAGRNAFFWFVLSMALSPLAGSIALIAANRYGVRWNGPRWNGRA